MAVATGLGLIQVSGARDRASKAEDQAIAQKLIAQSGDMLSTGADAPLLQRLLAGRHLLAESDDTQLCPMVLDAASTVKIIDNPSRPG